MVIEKLSPKWENNKTAICVSSSNEYAKYLSVYLESIKYHSNTKKYYDIVIFERNISDRNKSLIINAISAKNISVRFFNPSQILSQLQMYVTHSYFKEECYYRICAPAVLKEYSKVIFTDIDIILQDDILKLADINMQNMPIAACIEPLWHDIYSQDRTIEGYRIREYAESVLALYRPEDEYFNTGVVVFDVKEFNRLNSFERLSELINTNRFLYQEQCALNKFFCGQFIKLSPIWNYEVASYLSCFDKYKEYEVDAKILHFLGRVKPWSNPRTYLAEKWWSYARHTPFYEEIIIQYIASETNAQQYTNIYLSYILSNLTRYKIKKNVYRVLKLVTWGKPQQRFTQKHRKTKELIKAATMLKRNLSKSISV